MSWVRANKRSVWIVGLTLLVPVILYLDALLGLLAVRSEYQGDATHLERRIARLQGLVAFEDVLRESSTTLGSQTRRLYHPPSADQAEVSATLQTDVRRMLVEAGLSVNNSQVLPVRIHDHFDYIAVKLMVSGELAGLDAALASLAEHQPALMVESLEIWPNRVPAGKKAPTPQTLSASLQVLSLRAIR